jgi:hypothetical protein
MARDLILGRLHQDMACAIALTIVENPHVVANLEAITLHDTAMRPLGTVRNWLTDTDPLDQATREYLSAKREASMVPARRPGQSDWVTVSGVKKRESATQRACRARELGRALLAERGILTQARKAGLSLIGVD